MRFLLTLLLFWCSTVGATHLQLPEARAVVKPVVSSNQRGNGSGVIISQGVVVTAAHVVKGIQGQRSEVFLKDGEKLIKLEVRSINEANDVAVLTGEVSCPCAVLASRIDLDAPAYAVGYPIGIVTGYVQFLTEGRTQGLGVNDRVWTDAPTLPGNSGGGLFQVQDGRVVLIGISSSIVSSSSGAVFPHMSNSVNVKHVLEELLK